MTSLQDLPDFPLRVAELRVAMFAALKGWGQTGPDGKWFAWNGDQLRAKTDDYVFGWALNMDGILEQGDGPREMVAADIGIGEG